MEVLSEQTASCRLRAGLLPALVEAGEQLRGRQVAQERVFLMLNLKGELGTGLGPRGGEGGGSKVVDIYLRALQTCLLNGYFERYCKGVGTDAFITWGSVCSRFLAT